MRAALYARFSTDQQSAASIPDQLRLCRAHAERLGATVAAEFSDAAISGQAIANRPGLVELLARARAGEFDLVVAEHTDRLSRSGGGSWDIYDELKALGVAIDTVNQGRIGAMHVGLSGTMSALMIEEIARKTRRGLEGVVAAGRAGGGHCYGYRKVLAFDERGQQIRGLREIDPQQAAIVRRIFTDYAAGVSPMAIVGALNREGVPGPRGGPWSTSTLHGQAARGNGVLHNELYRGVLVWGRQVWIKDRHTGRRRSRLDPSARKLRVELPELRIVDEELWAATRARHAERSFAPRGAALKRPRKLLSGLLLCGLCGGPMTFSGPKGAMRCQTRATRGADACSNSRSPGYGGIEARVLAAVKANLLHPQVIEAAIREYQHQQARKARRRAADRMAMERELGEVKRRADRLIDQVADGVLDGRDVRERLDALRARRQALEEALEPPSAEVVEMHPAAAVKYRKLVDALRGQLEQPATAEDAAAREAFRALIQEIKVTPLEAFGQYGLEIIGDLAPILRIGDEEFKFSPRNLGAGTCSQRELKVAPLPVRMSA